MDACSDDVCHSTDESLAQFHWGRRTVSQGLFCTIQQSSLRGKPSSVSGYGLEVDMWALGVITYILLCGFPPFRSHERRQSELFELIKRGTFEFLPPYWDAVSLGKSFMQFNWAS
ncbi:unnamed protein product [Protopolystoma xenopodis]|uniref:Protein kinase domain-containing protein n=1 Tax=Protopolystoma xenopodis TaxID=117903 RepID=A0A3S5CHS0_9PLAT|nr:unnamed protein product [Protopolystoma xenopodis]